MNFDYTLKLDLPLEQAWTTLMDIERIAPCMPGATIESHDGDDYVGRLKVKLGPMEMTYRGNIHFVERDDVAKVAVVDASAKEIKGRGAAKTQVTLRGTAIADGAEINLSSEFTVSGKAAQFGRGVMEEVGEKLMGDFAQRLASQVSAAGAANPVVATAPTQAATPAPPPSTAADEEHTASNDESTAGTGETSTATEALDIGGAVWWPVLKRLAIPAGIAALIVVIYFSL